MVGLSGCSATIDDHVVAAIFSEVGNWYWHLKSFGRQAREHCISLRLRSASLEQAVHIDQHRGIGFQAGEYRRFQILRRGGNNRGDYRHASTCVALR